MRVPVQRCVILLDLDEAALQRVSDFEDLDGPITPEIWSAILQSVCDYARVVFDLFHGDKRLSLIINGATPVVLNTWANSQQTLSHVMERLSSHKYSSDATSDRSSTDRLNVGLRAAVRLLTEGDKSGPKRIKQQYENIRLIVMRSSPTEARANADEGVLHSRYFEVSDGVTDVPTDDLRLMLLKILNETFQSDRVLLDLMRRVELCVLNYTQESLPLNSDCTATVPMDIDEGSVVEPSYFSGVRRLSSVLYSCAYTVPCNHAQVFMPRLVRLHYSVHLMLICGIPMKENAGSHTKNSYDVSVLLGGESTLPERLSYQQQEDQLYLPKTSAHIDEVRVKWPSKGKLAITGAYILPVVSAFRVTPVDVTDSAASVIMKHVLSGKTVGLPLASEESGTHASYALKSKEGAVYLHRLASPSPTVGLVATSEQYKTNKSNDYRTKKFNSLVTSMTAHDMRNAKGRRIAHVVLNAPVDENVDGQPKKANHMTDKSSVKGTDSASRAAAQPVYSGKSVTAGPTHKPGSMYETLEHIEHATRGFTLAYSKGFYSTTTSDPQMDQDCLHPIGIAMAKKSMTEDDFKTAIAAVRALSSKLPPKVVRKPLKKGQTTDKTQKQRGSKPTSHQTAVASQSASPTRAIKAKSYWNNLLTYATLFENSSKAHGMVVAHIRRSMEMALEMADAPDTPIVVTEGTTADTPADPTTTSTDTGTTNATATATNTNSTKTDAANQALTKKLIALEKDLTQNLKYTGTTNAPGPLQVEANSTLLGVWKAALVQKPPSELVGRVQGPDFLYDGKNDETPHQHHKNNNQSREQSRRPRDHDRSNRGHNRSRSPRPRYEASRDDPERVHNNYLPKSGYKNLDSTRENTDKEFSYKRDKSRHNDKRSHSRGRDQHRPNNRNGQHPNKYYKGYQNTPNQGNNPSGNVEGTRPGGRDKSNTLAVE